MESRSATLFLFLFLGGLAGKKSTTQFQYTNSVFTKEVHQLTVCNGVYCRAFTFNFSKNLATLLFMSKYAFSSLSTRKASESHIRFATSNIIRNLRLLGLTVRISSCGWLAAFRFSGKLCLC